MVAIILVGAALLLPIGWHVLASSANPWWDRLKPYVGEVGAVLLSIAVYFGVIVAVIAAAQSLAVGGQAMVAFTLSFFGVSLYRWLNGEDIGLD